MIAHSARASRLLLALLLLAVVAALLVTAATAADASEPTCGAFSQSSFFSPSIFWGLFTWDCAVRW